jgi:hypothetical protein
VEIWEIGQQLYFVVTMRLKLYEKGRDQKGEETNICLQRLALLALSANICPSFMFLSHSFMFLSHPRTPWMRIFSMLPCNCLPVNRT